jgi:hypothetical protein
VDKEESERVKAEAVLAMDNVLASVTALPDFRLRLVYTDGGEYDFDFKPTLAEGGAMVALLEPGVFAAVRLGTGGRSVVFSDEVDCCADGLRYEAELQKRGLPLPE